MKKLATVFAVLIAIGWASNGFAGQKHSCCDPMAMDIQVRCRQETLLPYHVSLKRADDAAKVEAALAQVTEERDDLQSQLAK